MKFSWNYASKKIRFHQLSLLSIHLKLKIMELFRTLLLLMDW